MRENGQTGFDSTASPRYHVNIIKTSEVFETSEVLLSEEKGKR
jgi:hypothetical protein